MITECGKSHGTMYEHDSTGDFLLAITVKHISLRIESDA